MQKFEEIRFPEDVSFGSKGGPEFYTTITSTQNGYENRNINWNYARARYNVSHGVKNREQLNNLISFFRARYGKAIGFRFKDWTDYKGENQQIGVADGKTTVFQLQKTYDDGQSHYVRKIHKPVRGTVFISIDHETTEDFETDFSTGKITFHSPPLEGAIHADFEFDVPVRFDTDFLDVSMDYPNSYSWSNINLVEIKINE